MSLSIPAWKRLGLKLKYAKDQPDVADVSGVERISTQGPQVTENHDGERPHKRQRTSKTAKEETNYSQDLDQTRKSPMAVELKTTSDSPQRVDGATNTTVHKTPKRQKSVTFSTDTKASDGDSRITIDFPAGSPGSTPYKANQSRDAVDSDLATPDDEPEKSKKKKKSSSVQKLNRQQPNGKGKTDSALPYLAQHRHDKESWKFNKNRDVWIVSHALDIKAIPSDHVLALAGYVKGLPTKAGARQRLIQQCRDSLAELEDSTHQGKEEQEKFLALLENSQANVESHIEFLDSIPRPVVLLWSLGEDVESAKNIGATESLMAISKPLAERKRKTRTAAPIELSSSESDSGTDSSDSETGDDDGQSGAKVSNGIGISSMADDTSSSGTDSSSSSDSSSEDDSD